MLIGFLLIGKTINLTSDDVVIQSNNFNVDKYGNMSCSNATVNGGTITGAYINLISTNQTCANPFLEIVNSDNTDEKVNLGSRYMRFTSPDGDSMIDISSANSNEAGYNPEIQIWRANGQFTGITAESIVTSGDMYCNTLYQTSLKEKKKNFENFENALDIIKSIDIYKYNFKNENDEDKKHIGFVIGQDFEYSKEVTSKNNEGVDIYSFVSVCCKAIQEQQEQIEALQKEIKELKEGLNNGLL